MLLEQQQEYDLLGILSPITICFQIFFQRLCVTKLGWDDQLVGELVYHRQTLTLKMKQVKPVAVPRCPLPMNEADHPTFQLVGFCDASLSAIVYLQI